VTSPLDVTGAELRKWAARCAAQAKETRSIPDRARLLAMRDALLDLADNEDWLSGKVPLVPAQPAPIAGASQVNGRTHSHDDR
jgi:hypothetical protein